MGPQSRIVIICNRIALCAFLLFLLAGAVLVGVFSVIQLRTIVEPISSNDWFLRILVGWAVVAMLLSAPTLICAMVLRDIAANGWRFSLRTMLIAATMIAVVLGLIVWRVR